MLHINKPKTQETDTPDFDSKLNCVKQNQTTLRCDATDDAVGMKKGKQNSTKKKEKNMRLSFLEQMVQNLPKQLKHI